MISSRNYKFLTGRKFNSDQMVYRMMGLMVLVFAATAVWQFIK
jgi:hypothetical protein